MHELLRYITPSLMVPGGNIFGIRTYESLSKFVRDAAFSPPDEHHPCERFGRRQSLD